MTNEHSAHYRLYYEAGACPDDDARSQMEKKVDRSDIYDIGAGMSILLIIVFTMKQAHI